MKIANIYPIANQQFYRCEEYVMILAHLVKKNLYDKKHFCDVQYIIMDNGLFEGEQVSTNLQDLIDLAERSEIPVDEIIVPDVINDLDATIELFEKNLETIRKYNKKYRFMFVAQAATYKDLERAIDYINQYEDLELTVGISKLSPLNRDSDFAIEQYKKCKFPIHFLGIKSTLNEILRCVEYIRSCDTSQLAFVAKNVKDISKIEVFRYVRMGK